MESPRRPEDTVTTSFDIQDAVKALFKNTPELEEYTGENVIPKLIPPRPRHAGSQESGA
ncbi:MAG: hypothetical protein ACT4TC_10990 [Myxococcaceae bacterium]